MTVRRAEAGVVDLASAPLFDTARIPDASPADLPQTPANAEELAAQAVQRWCQDVRVGRPWADALLSAIGAWPLTREICHGRDFEYLVEGEAFDWLLLAERLLMEVRGAVPLAEQESLLFHGELPAHVSRAQFREALGVAKYRAHLNFFYGVVVEEALWHATERDVVKQRSGRGVALARDIEDLVAQRLYGRSFAALLRAFHRGKGRKVRVKHRLSDWKAFSYWCFRQRIAKSDQARIASDTDKGLRVLADLRDAHGARNATAQAPQLRVGSPA